MVALRDSKTGVTAMARATASTVSAVAQMIASGLIKQHGVFPPEMIVPGEAYLKDMANRGLIIKETIR